MLNLIYKTSDCYCKFPFNCEWYKFYFLAFTSVKYKLFDLYLKLQNCGHPAMRYHTTALFVSATRCCYPELFTVAKNKTFNITKKEAQYAPYRYDFSSSLTGSTSTLHFEKASLCKYLDISKNYQFNNTSKTCDIN